MLTNSLYFFYTHILFILSITSDISGVGCSVLLRRCRPECPSPSIVRGVVFGSGRPCRHTVFRAGVSVLPSRRGRPIASRQGISGCGASLIDFDVPLVIVFVFFEGGRPIPATFVTGVFQRRENPGHHSFQPAKINHGTVF